MLKGGKMFSLIYAHAPFCGHTGYANHAREFFTALNERIPVRIRNFTHTSNISYLTQSQKDMVVHQTWGEPPWEIGTPFNPKSNEKLLNIILMETNHMYFYDSYQGPKIALNVWESTEQPVQFFEKLKEFDQIWVPTQWQRDCTIKQGISSDKVFVVPEGVDIDKFKPIDWFNKKRFDDGRFKFMIFGRWDYRKYTKEMVQAFIEEFEKDEPVGLIISADNPWPVDEYKSTEERLEKYGLQDDRIEILHFPSDEKYIDYLQRGHALLMVSRSEGWGLPACEALACGTPTLIVDWGASLEFGKYAYKVKVKEFKKPENVFIQDNVPGVWSEPDFDDMKKQMRYIYENYDECRKYTMDNIDFIRNFTWQNSANIAMDIINKIDYTKYYPVKLNIGSGEYPKKGYINIDKYYDKADQMADALSLPYEDHSVSELYSSHLLEHLNKYDIKQALNEWFRILKYEGKIHIEVPDFESIIEEWKKSEDKTGFSMDTIFGLQTRQGEEHKFGFTVDILRDMLLDTGFFDISIKKVFSHSQDCIEAIAYKKEIKYDDEVIIMDCYPNTEEKMDILLNSIDKAKETNLPIALVTHYPLPLNIIEKVDYLIYDKNNPLSENYSLTFWMNSYKKLKIVTSLNNPYHGLCCLTSMKNAATFLRNKYNFAHFIEYDVEANLESYIKRANYHRSKGKKFIGFDYHHTIPKQDGIITNFFSFDIKWFDDNIIEMKKWSEYRDESARMCDRINATSDLILEHWIYHYFKDRNMLKDTYILSTEEKEKIIIRGNIRDQMDEEPEMHFRISETDDHKLIMFVMRDDRVHSVGTYKVEHIVDGVSDIYEGTLESGKTEYSVMEKIGVIKVSSGNYYKEFVIDPNMTYQDTIFRFYDDRIKCITWNSEYDDGFMDVDDDKFIYSFMNGAKVEIVGKSSKEYEVDFINRDTGLSVYKTTLTPNHWGSPSPRYYINWDIIIKHDGKEVSRHIFDCTGKNVMIQTDSSSLGDTIAWIPYINEFRKKHNCKVYGRTFHNSLYEKEYPDIIWVFPDKAPVENIYAYYEVGCRDNDYNSNKNNWRSVPLQKVASDYLGLDYQEIRPKITKSTKDRPIKEKYVAISEHSTFQCKYWLNQKGWPMVIEYLKAKGYEVMVISKEPTNLKGIIDKTNRPMEETINNIQHADLFIGVSSGPTWMAWALDVPTVLISGYSAVWGEFQDNCARIITPKGKCSGCFNDRDTVLDRGNWNWCPRSKNFECSTSIEYTSVIEGIQKFI